MELGESTEDTREGAEAEGERPAKLKDGRSDPPRGPNGRFLRRGGNSSKRSKGKRGKKDSPSEVVKKLLGRVVQTLGHAEVKATVGDYIRLVQLQKEFDAESPREIQVSWVESNNELECGSEE